MGIFVNEEWLDTKRNLWIGESGVYETCMDTPGEVFRACQREHGRCVSKMYVDRESGAVPIGWVFVKRIPYDDAPRESFLRETWVSLHEGPPTRTVKCHYLPIG